MALDKGAEKAVLMESAGYISTAKKGVNEMTILDLCKEVARTGSLDTSSEKAIEYQDVIGHSNTGTLEEVANTPELIESFYRIYGVAYGTPAAIKYYVEHSDRQMDQRQQLEDAKATLEKRDTRIKELEKALLDVERIVEENEVTLKEIRNEMKRNDTAIKSAEDENIKLKAELYDLMKENEVMRRALTERS